MPGGGVRRARYDTIMLRLSVFYESRDPMPGAGVRDGTLRYDNVAFELATFLAVSGSVCKGQGHFTIR